MYCRIVKKPARLNAAITLPASKSISNRALIIRELCSDHFPIENLSNAGDTVLLESLLQKKSATTVDASDAGTVFRFLTAFYAIQEGREVELTGNARMQERPVGPLVDALKDLGADIVYLKEEGFPPLRILGKKLRGGKVKVDSSISSQFVSALLLVAPLMEDGLEIQMTGKPVSSSYIELTVQIMNYFGVKVGWEGNSHITVAPQKYIPRPLSVEADWSSASFWYGLIALSYSGRGYFKGLNKKSPQGDRILSSYMNNFGVKSHFRTSGVEAIKSGNCKPYFVKNMINCPDLIPVMTVLCSCFNISLHIRGTKTLTYKESDRAEVLKQELSKLGYNLELSENEMRGIPSQLPLTKEITLDAHGDHRMAMAFSLHSYINDLIRVKGPEVVEKSFPEFWDTLKDNGIEVKVEP